ncbi:MAG: 2-oxoacid:acceptor oxidoreductase subunit alpha [Rhodospirillaceae bacterium]|jgi:2-oxoglutarate ferredoxin oxidoreductase subunit alpha|nr:2-oxoacid:acceptor oxidoreductase subunit alpha [Rhodospirillaceae bacterium]MBT3930322.1 2-oxoacid:acceptor oxidoreductase subunit alpha [Rhodospirillaceae bacterium]MBT4772174.1 2-oxoacid:acceptor oxidoreductase subunit alpha [Rhodospirillaceae bacterium]MBT5359461.1 2-oxoacid:acceptor oxidoreductase subunit alpha [Rhodospirillaceae bacterium]MBT5768346.1 2-oxoacid:acceptor oxidoreductase subunit alpha [Rhodospirillaceae bacterium]
MSEVATAERSDEGRQEVESAVVRFAGDSGDGMQLTGSHFTMTAAIAGNDLATFPDFPAEIRAPAGTTFGVSAFQINFGARKIMTSGDLLDVLVVMNPAALVTNLADVKPNGIVIADSGAFTARNLTKAGYEENPLENDSLEGYRLVKIDMSRLTVEAVKEFGLSNKEALRSKNMWALGVVYWMYGRKRQASIDWLETKFAKQPDIAKANIAALNAGHAFGETAEMPAELGTYEVESATIEPGLYRTITGGESVSLGLLAGSLLADLKIAFCSYPITPASALLHQLARMKEFGVVTFQAEDEIAAAAAAIGASYAGALGITSSSGPGIALKMEAIGLAIATELPLVVINSQRAGPSTGLPTKTEQSDLYQAVYGRNGDAPMPVISVSTPSDGYEVAIEAVRIATKYMTPVMVLTDGYITNASEPWLIPDAADAERFDVEFRTDPENFQPFMRDGETLARPWVKPGTPDLMHRIGGIERSYDSGHISYDPENHQKMTDVRAAKVLGIANDIPEQTIEVGEAGAKLAVVGWGSTYGPINRAVNNMRDEGLDVAQIHLRYIWPLPRNLGELLGTFDQILVPEMNTGQLRTLLRDQFLLPAEGHNKVNGKPFLIGELEDAIRARLEK